MMVYSWGAGKQLLSWGRPGSLHVEQLLGRPEPETLAQKIEFPKAKKGGDETFSFFFLYAPSLWFRLVDKRREGVGRESEFYRRSQST